MESDLGTILRNEIAGIAGTSQGRGPHDVGVLVAGFDVIASIAAGATGETSCKVQRPMTSAAIVAGLSLQQANAGFLSFRIDATEQFVGSGPCPCTAFTADAKNSLKMDLISQSSAAKILVVNHEGTNAVTNAMIAIVGPAKVN